MALTKKDISELLDQKLDEKLEPIKKDISTIKKDLQHTQEVVEKEFKKMNERFDIVEERLDRLDNQVAAVIEDYEPRLKRLEKKTDINQSN